MYYFLQGPPKTGKSTLLRAALRPHEATVAGFMVQRLFERGRQCGHRAAIVKGSLPTVERTYCKELEGVFLYNKESIPGILEQVINRAALLCTKDKFDFILLDEIGGIELLSRPFMERLGEILTLGKPTFGVLKSKKNLAQTADQLNLPDPIFKEWERLHRHITLNGELLTVTPDNMGQIAGFLRSTINRCRKNSVALEKEG